MKTLFCILGLILSCRLANAQVADQGSGSGNSGDAAAAAFTFPVTVSAGAHLAALCSFTTGCITACPDDAAVATLNGDTMTRLGQVVQGTSNKTWFFGLTNPDVGVGLTVSFDPSNDQRMSGGCLIWTGADQTTAFGTLVTNNNGGVQTLGCTVTITSNGAGAAGFGAGDSALDLEVSGTNVTERTDQCSTAATPANNRCHATGTSTTAGSQTFTGTTTANAQLTAVCVPINAVGTVAATRARPMIQFTQ